MAQQHQELTNIQFSDQVQESQVGPVVRRSQNIPTRLNQTKKPSAFRSNSSHSSKQKHVMFPNQHGGRARESSHGSRHRKRYNSFKGKANASDLSIEDINSQRDQSEEDSRILIHFSTNKTLNYESIKQSLGCLRKANKSLKNQFPKLQRAMLDWCSSLTQQLLIKMQVIISCAQATYRSQKQLLESNVARLESQLQEQNQKNRQLARQLEGSKIESKKSLHQNKEEGKPSRPMLPCPNCKIQQIKISSMRQDALQTSKKISQLSSQNQALQEKLFDLEQQVIGIDLEVQKKLKAAIASLPLLAPTQQTPQPNYEIIQSLTNNIEILTKKCQRYEEICKSEEELRRRQFEVDKAIKQYQLKNAALLEALARSEQTNDRNYQREHQLLLAEEEISKKLEQIRKKQIELSEWQTSLSQKLISQIDRSPAFRPTLQEVKRLSEEASQGSLIRNKRLQQEEQYYSEHRVQLPSRNIQAEVAKNHTELSQRSSIPHEQSTKTFDNMRITKDNIIQNYYNIRNNAEALYLNKPNRDSQSRKLHPSFSNRVILEKKHYAERTGGLNIRSKYEARKLSPSYRDRSSSPSLSFRSSNISYGIKGTLPQNKNLSGLENKLDRLRDELKRELQSIK